MPEKVVSPDRRADDRSDCELNGRIELSDGRAIPCIVKDLSTTGARIVISSSAPVPSQFSLLVPAVPGADQRFAVKLVWRHENEIGGEFISPSH